MSKIYDENHRKLQATFETERLADVVEEAIVHAEITDKDRAFIEARDMFFLSSIDKQGRPTVSYKGGDAGFIRVVDEKTLVFPSYDGNGMYMSMGNIEGNSQVGLLFIDFENPYRLRLQGEASIDLDDPLLKEYKEADLLVRVRVENIWQNCPRYVHKYTKAAQSDFVPRSDVETPSPDWKRVDILQGVLAPKDQGKVEQRGGLLTMDELIEIEARDD